MGAALDVAKLEKQEVREKTVASWCVEEQAMEVDIHQQQQGSEEEVTPGMSLWHQALGEVRSSAQLSLCIKQLQKSVQKLNRAAGGGKRGRAKLDSRGSCVKKAKLAKDYRDWLELYRVVLAELKAHPDARPFLFPVNLKAAPWYKRIIRSPLDFPPLKKTQQQPGEGGGIDPSRIMPEGSGRRAEVTVGGIESMCGTKKRRMQVVRCKSRTDWWEVVGASSLAELSL
ncbi:unnamed protein product [Pleuronectes platessa]|uniref:Bromo domain-containing protein n=1 Tax=Pleuronectes platessa TaxID=8262 RepID=A0A9N7YHC2_PLEPL|nr:unnamed protein product [Pleuronectes platessa]